MKKLLTSYFIPLMFLLLHLNINSQTYNFIHYDAEDGLAQSQVKTMVRDDNGILWIGTPAGLTKYDGKEFFSYTKIHGLSENYITSSFISKDGYLWLGHWGGGLTKFNPIDKSFEIINLEQYNSFTEISVINEDTLGNIWIGTKGASLYKYSPEEGKVYSIISNYKVMSRYITDIKVDDNNNVWVASLDGLYIYNSSFDLSKAKAYKYINKNNGLLSNELSCISIDSNSNLWVGYKKEGVSIIKTRDINNSNSLISTNKFKNLNTESGLSSNNITTIYQGDEGSIWIGTSGGGICIYTPSNDKEGILNGDIKIFTKRQGLNLNNVNNITRSRDGSYWIGTNLGLNQYLGDQFLIFDEKDGLSNNLVWTIFEDSNKDIWFGTNNGISKLSYKNRASYNLETLIEDLDIKLPGKVIQSIYEDNNKNLWIGTDKGIGIIEIENSRKPELKKFRRLRGENIFSISSDIDNNIWIGTGSLTYRYNPKKETLEGFGTKDGLGGNGAYRLYKDSKGNLWFAFLGGNLTKYDGKKFTVYNKKDGLENTLTLCITEDKNNKIWLGTYGDGLYKFDNGKFVTFSINDGLSTDAPHSIVCDNNGDLWVGTRQGVDKFNQADTTFTFFGSKEGFLGIETNGNSVCRDSDGNLWLGTIMGATRIDANYAETNKKAPVVLINRLSIRHRNSPFPEDNVFKYSDNYLTFHFIGVNLAQPEKVQYEYILEGFDKEPSQRSKKNEAIYTNLPPGDYTLKVKACNNNNVWLKEPATYSFTITPPFWETWWFYLIVVSSLFAAIYSTVKAREIKHKKEKERLERIVEKRTEEIRQQKDLLEVTNKDLAFKNNQIKDSIDYAQRIQEAVLTPINFLKSVMPDSFIFYQPKDVVSGDFYWVHKEGDVIYYAAADCTGHGVPGALMSIISFNSLEKVVKERRMLKPNEILQELGHLMVEALRQNQENVEVKDGLEIALCALNIKTRELAYSGTKHPLYIIRNSELIEYKGDKVSIGSDNIEGLVSYTNNIIQLEENDRMYIFSDGYPDQKGGPKKKKFMYKKFKNMLVEFEGVPFEKQEVKLKHVMDEWKGETEQYDDMLIIGLKV